MIGFTTVPTSSTAMYRSSSTAPVSVSSSTIATCAPDGHEKFGGSYTYVSSSPGSTPARSEEHTSELQSRVDLVCRLLLEKKKNQTKPQIIMSCEHTSE